MQYTTFPASKDSVSVLGLGCMRFVKKGSGIDQQKAERVMHAALNRGINYFDTAYIYGGNEVALGKFFAEGNRAKVLLATKLPHFRVKKLTDAIRIFEEQLARLQTDYIDYYLLHMLGEVGSLNRLQEMGVIDWLEKQKQAGVIRNIGFSYHGGTPAFTALIDAYPWDFCQIQYNYMDEFAQAGVDGLRYAYEKHIPVVIMEPLKGGQLTHRLPEDAKALLNSTHPDWSPAEWALRWLFRQKEVGVVLSGMNETAQIEENARIAALPKEDLLTAEDLSVIAQVKTIIDKKAPIACTGCGYCMPCPYGVDIPVSFRCYNNLYTQNWFQGFKQYLMQTTFNSNPSPASKCVQCGKCEPLCPQALPIREDLRMVKKKMETPLYKFVRWASKFFVKFEE